MKKGIRNTTGIVLGAALVVLFGALLLKNGNPPSPAATPGGTAIPDLVLADYDGNDVQLRDFEGKALVLNSWASWCPFCLDEMPAFETVQKEFGDRVLIVLINREESLATAKKFSDQVGVTGDLVLLLDPKDSFYSTIGGFGMPETLFINASGELVFHKRGPMELDEIRERIETTLSSS